jgi:PAS domain S-box-containing protein
MLKSMSPLTLLQLPAQCFGLPAILSAAALLISTASIVWLFYSWLRNATFSRLQLNKTLLFTSAIFKTLEGKLSAERTSHADLIKAIDAIANQAPVQPDLHLDREGKDAIDKLQSKLSAVKEEENQRLWSAQGIAQIVEIRDNNTGIDEYTFQIIKHIVKYLNANQAAFYILNDDQQSESFLECTATYAYGRRKYSHEKIKLELGTGLLGQTALEGTMTLLSDVPKDYVKITSGLGEALPRFIAITPLIFRNETLGVLEIATFSPLAQYQIDFLKKASDTIALELNVIRSNERRHRAVEQSREQELRQSLEEMRAVQKEMLIKESELSKQLESTQKAMAMADAERRKNEAILEGCMDAVICFNHKGSIQYFNKAAEEIFGVSREEISNRNIRQILEVNMVSNDSGDVKILTGKGSEVALRTEVNAIDGKGDEMSLLLTLANVKMDGEYLFTLFAQKVSVELF